MDESAMPSMFVCDASDGRPIGATEAALALLGVDADGFLRLPATALEPFLAAGRHRHVRPDGSAVELELSTQLLQGAAPARLIVARPAAEPAPPLDLTDRSGGLAGRPAVLQRLGTTLPQARAGSTVALLFVDVEVADGDPTAERVTDAVAERLQSSVRRSDLVARIGPTAFAVVCDQLQGEIDAAGLAAEVVDDLMLPLVGQTGVVFPRVGIGVALAGDPGMTAAELAADADAAMQAAKHQGRARHAAFATAARTRSRRRQLMARALSDALAAGEVTVDYQPLIDLRSGTAVGVEALARWRPPDGPAISPDRFIPVAERSGLIVPLGDLVLARACRFAAERPHLDVAVNVSPYQVRDQFVDRVAAILAEAELPATRLRLELTESAFLADPDRAMAVLRHLTVLGVRLSLDDFGTGYSSLWVLRRLPFERLKIDRSFVRTVAETRADRDVVAAVIALARAVGVATTAEGVETDDQASVLLDLGCDEAQGFLFGRPMPAGECDAWFEADTALN